ncbi:MAG: molybdopterin-dependent oxidoreductase [Deltaproteobacteria bacterium]|nr:molybdopterin-dependent oxidoreductase [Deltaproteobacteria bacterium]
MSFIQLPHPTQRLKTIEERGGRIVIIDPRRTESAKKLGKHHFIRPSTDVFFMMGFLNELIRQGGVDGDRISKHMKHYEDLKEISNPWTAERVAEVTGIAAADLKELVTNYIDADGATIYSSTGVNQGGNGVLTFWLQECINAISGNLDRRGGSIVGLGIADLPGLGAKNKMAMGTERSRVGDLPSAVDSFPAAIMADEILTPGPNQVRALIVAAGNPLLTVPNGTHLAEALEDLELLVCTDIQRSETTEYADYILPGTTFLQRPDLPFLFHSMMGMQPTPFVQYTDPVLEPDGEQRDELWMFAQLCRASGSPMFGSRIFQSALNLGYALGRLPFLKNWLTPAQERILGLVTLFTGQGTLRKLRKFPHGKLIAPQEPGNFLGQRVLTEDGKVDLAPADFLELANRLDGLFEQELAQAHRLKLISKRERYTHNSWTHNIERMVKGDRNTNYIYMHPNDAEQRSLSNGDLAEVETKTAVITLPVRITEDMMPGAVAVPHGWGHQQAEGLNIAKKNAGANVNLLAADGPESVEPISGMAHLTGFIVDVRAAENN